MCNKTEVVVGLSISLTGKCRPLGQQALQGIRLWQSYINAQGGIAVRNGEKSDLTAIVIPNQPDRPTSDDIFSHGRRRLVGIASSICGSTEKAANGRGRVSG